jgi:hypothetical protein
MILVHGQLAQETGCSMVLGVGKYVFGSLIGTDLFASYASSTFQTNVAQQEMCQVPNGMCQAREARLGRADEY